VGGMSAAGLRPGLGRGGSVQSFVIAVVLPGVVADESEDGSEAALCNVDIVEMEDRERMVGAETGSSCGGVGGW